MASADVTADARDAVPSHPPKCSIVIPTHNRATQLERCLRALGAQTLDPSDFEVVVVDDGSTDHTARMLADLSAPFRLQMISRAKDGPFVARNAGARAAQGPVCVFLDDDVIAAAELAAEHLTAHRGDARVFGIGRLSQIPARGWYAREFAAYWNRHYEALERRPARWTDGWGGNLSVPRDAFLDVGGFSAQAPPATGDIELSYRLHRHGLRPVYLPRAHGEHDDQKGRARLLEDARRQGEADAELARREPGMIPGFLGWFGETTNRELVLRRMLIALRIPATALAAIGPFWPGAGRRQIWFDFVSRYTFWLGVRGAVERGSWTALTRGVPVLMYHAFAPSGDGQRYVVSKRRLALQMWALKALRYRVIGFDELARALRDHHLPDHRAAVITIDDGYRDTLEVAHPVLRRHGYPAALFVVSDRLDATNDWDADGELAGRPLLSLAEIRRLADEQVAIGAHTRTHPSLPDVQDEVVQSEVAGARAELERAIGRPVSAFTYPYGRRDERAVAAARAAGYLGAGTTEPHLVGPGDDPMLIPRIEIFGTDPLWRFVLKLWFGAA